MEPEYFQYDTAGVFLEERWYAKYELEEILAHLLRLNEMNSKSMEQA